MFKLISYVAQHPLNSGARFQAMLRLLRWQVASRLLPGPIALQFVEDTRLFASRGMTGATGNWYCGLHEVEEMGFLLHVLRPGDLFLDVGANVGSYTVLAAGGIGARVIAVEPIPTTFENLQNNMMLNGLAAGTELHCVGLSNQRSHIQFTANLDTVNHVMTNDEGGPAVRIPVLTMDELLDGRAPAIIKIDVEGHELAVLQGASATLSDPRVIAVVMEINGSGARYGIHDDDLLATMTGHGFAPCGYDPIARRIRDWVPTGGNAIFIRDRVVLQTLASEAKHYRLVNGTI